MNIDGLRQEYIKNRLEEATTGVEPVALFRKWLDEAIHSDIPEPTAMSLSTVSPSGRPSSRIVLLKGIDNGRFTFFSNYESEKGMHLKITPYASLLFFWPYLERQVRVEGRVEKAEPEESDYYFNSRPLESRLSALASPQSRVVNSREELEKLVELFSAETGSKGITRPVYWGGYVLNPDSIEFWQGRAGRLHDRIRFRRSTENHWIRERLAP